MRKIVFRFLVLVLALGLTSVASAADPLDDAFDACMRPANREVKQIFPNQGPKTVPPLLVSGWKPGFEDCPEVNLKWRERNAKKRSEGVEGVEPSSDKDVVKTWKNSNH